MACCEYLQHMRSPRYQFTHMASPFSGDMVRSQTKRNVCEAEGSRYCRSAAARPRSTQHELAAHQSNRAVRICGLLRIFTRLNVTYGPSRIASRTLQNFCGRAWPHFLALSRNERQALSLHPKFWANRKPISSNTLWAMPLGLVPMFPT